MAAASESISEPKKRTNGVVRTIGDFARATAETLAKAADAVVKVAEATGRISNAIAAVASAGARR